MSVHDYMGHQIRVDTLPGVRPWAVWVDGELVLGKGERVRRRLSFAHHLPALAAGRRHVRALVALEGDLCARIAARAVELGLRPELTGAHIARVIATAHKRCPLRLRELLTAAEHDFAHDVGGMVEHWPSLSHDAERGVYGGFRPRYAQRQARPLFTPEEAAHIAARAAGKVP